MKFKMVVTDLDDTLLRSDKTISTYTIDTIQKVREMGISVIFATARGGSTKTLISLDMFDGYVWFNGAKAYVNNELIYDRTIPADIYAPLLKNLSNHNLNVAAEINGTHYANFNVKNKWPYIDNYVMTDYEAVAGGADKLYAIIEHPDQVEIITKHVPDELYVHVSRDGLAMMMNKGATKSNGILAIAEEMDVSKDEIVAFGDDINDKDMFLNSGLRVAVENAIDEIKGLADDICETNNQDGVAKWLHANILEDNRMQTYK